MRVGEVLRRVRNRMSWWLHFQQLFARRKTTLRTGQRSPVGGAYFHRLEPRVLLSSAPTNISLDHSSIDENLPASSVIGVLTTTDSDVGDSFVYSLVAGVGDDDNAAFELVGDELKGVEGFDFEAQSSYTFRLRTTDSDDLFFEKTFTITINDVNDTPEAVDDTVSVVMGDSVEIDVLANDSDPEETDITIKSIGAVSSGAAEIITLGDGSKKIRYTASGGAVGEITFTYTIEDEDGLTDTATVKVNIQSYTPDPDNLLPNGELGTPDLLNDLLDGIGPHSPVFVQPLTLPEIGSVPDMVSQANVADVLLAQFDVSSRGNVSSSVSNQSFTDTITTPSTELGGTFVVDISTTTSYTRTGTENATTGDWSYEDVFSMTYSYLTTFTHDTASLAYTLLQTGSLSYTFEAMFVGGVLTFSIADYLQVDDYLLTMTGSIEEDATPDEDNPTDWTYTNSTTVDELSTEVPDVYSGSQEIAFDYSQSVERDAVDEIVDQTISQDLDVEVIDSYTIARAELWKSVSSDPEVRDSTTLLLATATGQLSWSLISSYDQIIVDGDLVSLSESFAYESAAEDHSTLDLTSSLTLSSTAVVGTLLMDQPTAPQTETLTQTSTYSEEVTSSVEYTFNGQRAIDATGDETYNVSYDYSDDVDGSSQEESEGTYHSELTGEDELHILDTTSSLDESLTWGSSLDAIASNVKTTSGSTNSATRTYDESMTILSSSTLTSTLSKLTAPGSTSTANESVLTDEYADSIDSTYTFSDLQTAYVAADIAYYSGLSTSHLLSDESVEMTSTTLYRPSQSASETPDVIVTVIEQAEFSTESSTDLTVTTDYDIVVDVEENTVTTDTVQTTDDISSGVDILSLTSTITSAGLISGSTGTGKTESELRTSAGSTTSWDYDLNDVLTTTITVESQEVLVQTEDGEVEGVQVQMAIASTQVTTLSSNQSGSESLSASLESRTVLATGALEDDLGLVEDLDEFTFADAETMGETLTNQAGSILVAEISSSESSTNAFSSSLESVTTLTLEDDEITIIAYGETTETLSGDDAETSLLTTSDLVSESLISSSSDFSSEVYQHSVSSENDHLTTTTMSSIADDSYSSLETIEEETSTLLSFSSSTGVSSLTLDTFIVQSSSGSGLSSSNDSFQISVLDTSNNTYRQNDSYSIVETYESTTSSLSTIDVGSSTISHDANEDGVIDEDEISMTTAPSTITSTASFSTTEESSVDNVTYSEIGFITSTTEYHGVQEGTTEVETASSMTVDEDGSVDLEQTSSLESSGTVTSQASETYLLLDTDEMVREGYSLEFGSGNDYSVSTTTLYTVNQNALTGLTTEVVLTDLMSSSETTSFNESSGSAGPLLGANTSSFSGETSVDSTSTAEVKEWKELITDADGEIISEAFEIRRELLDQSIVSGEYSGSNSQGSYTGSYEDKTGRRVTEVHLGDEDYEYFFKDQTSGSSYTFASTGQSSQTLKSRLHTTLEYEIFDKGTEDELIREWVEQRYLRGSGGASVDPEGNVNESGNVNAGRTRVGEYATGGTNTETGWATDPKATPQSVGSGNNPSSVDGPWGGQGGPPPGGGSTGGGGTGPGDIGGGPGSPGGGGSGGSGAGTAGGNTSGSTVTSTDDWETHEDDAPEAFAVGARQLPPPHHKVVGAAYARQEYNANRRDAGDRILEFAGEYMSIPYVTDWLAGNIRGVVGDETLVNASGNQLVAGTVIVSTGAVVGGYYVVGTGTALAGGNGWAAASSGLGALNTISLTNNAASLTIDPTVRHGFDTTADLFNMGMTVGGKLLNGRTKLAATALDIGINGVQSVIGINDAIVTYQEGHEEWAYFQGALAGLGFAGAGLRFHENFQVSIDTSRRSFSTSMLGTGVFDRISIGSRTTQNSPSWTTIRSTIWKQLGEAELDAPSGYFSQRNIARMLEGRAPRVRAEVTSTRTGVTSIRQISVEIHHQKLAQMLGGRSTNQLWNLIPVYPWSHESIDPFRHTGYILNKIINGTNSY